MRSLQTTPIEEFSSLKGHVSKFFTLFNFVPFLFRLRKVEPNAARARFC